MEKSNAEVLDLLIGRIEREMGQFKSLVGMWDVINEMVIMPVFDKYDNAITRLCNHYGRVELAKILFDTARAADPTAQLLINDFNTTEEYAQLVAELLDAGVQIDAIGIQSHQHQGYWGDEKLARVLERFSRFDLPLHFSENTFISGQLMPPEIVDLNDHQVDAWPTTEEGEERQARDVERFYTHLFAHPKVEVIEHPIRRFSGVINPYHPRWSLQPGVVLELPSGDDLYLRMSKKVRIKAFHITGLSLFTLFGCWPNVDVMIVEVNNLGGHQLP